MTEIEQALSDDKVRAELAKLVAETSKINAETSKINKENQWYLLIVGSTATLAIAAVVKIFF